MLKIYLISDREKTNKKQNIVYTKICHFMIECDRQVSDA